MSFEQPDNIPLNSRWLSAMRRPTSLLPFARYDSKRKPANGTILSSIWRRGSHTLGRFASATLFSLALLLMFVMARFFSAFKGTSTEPMCYDCRGPLNENVASFDRDSRILVAVNSQCKNVHRWAHIWTSWARQASEMAVQGVFDVKFIVGRPQAGEECDRLVDQWVTRTRMLDMDEDYNTLPKKTAQIIHAAREGNYDALIKVDDDVAVDVGRLVAALRTLNFRNDSIYMGFIHRHAPVRRQGKWTDATFPLNEYPPYAAGPFYLLSRPLLRWLSDGLQQGVLRDDWKNEDASVGAWLLGTNVEYVHSDAVLPCWSCKPKNASQPAVAWHLQDDTVQQSSRDVWVASQLQILGAKVARGELLQGVCCSA